MARPNKQGLDYFPIDVDLDQDDKLGMVIGEFGEKGERLFVKLLCFIYKHEGYYTEWQEDAQLRFLRRYSYCGFSMSFIQEVVPRFIKWGLFDKTVFNTFQVLTSERIQETWLDASRKRKSRFYNKNFWLIDVFAGLKAEETELKAEETTQRKEKENKENESNSPPEAFISEEDHLSIKINHMLIPEMLQSWKSKKPNYFSVREVDFQALLQIAYHIAKFKGWKNASIVEENKNDLLKSWVIIIDFILKDSWYKEKDLTYFSMEKNWSSLVNKMIEKANSQVNGKSRQQIEHERKLAEQRTAQLAKEA